MLKSQLTCSYCSKMYKHPIILPCNDTICREHLFERNVVKENRLKCKACNEELGVKGYDFKSNETLSQLIESHSYLNEEEMSLKRELEDSIRQFFDFLTNSIRTRHSSTWTLSIIFKKFALKWTNTAKS